MKTFVFRLAVAVFVLFMTLFVVWREMVNPVFSGIALCFHDEAEQMDAVYQQATAMEDMTARRELVCQADVESTTSLRGCLRQVKSEFILGDVLINHIPRLGLNTKKRVNFTVREHNRLCPDLPIAEEWV